MGNFITMPKLGMTMTEGTITKWLVSEGERIEKGDYIFETETDKTSLEVDSLYSGVMLKIYYSEGDTIPVNEPLAYIGEVNENIPELPPIKGAAQAVDSVDACQAAHSAPAVISAATNPTEKSIRPEGNFDYDLIVIGAGPGGYVAAIRASQLGAKVAVAEKATVGGVCLNRGCIPTKAFYTCAKHYRDILRANEFGITVNEVKFDWQAILTRKDKIVKKLTGGVESLFKRNKIELIRGEAVVEKEHEVVIGGKTYTTAYTLIATGTSPASIVKADEKLPTTDDILNLNELPKSLAIIGGGVIGCEIAGIFRTFGVKTTVIELAPRILPMADEEISAALAKRMAKSGVNIVTGVTAGNVTRDSDGYRISLSNGEVILADMALEAVGRTPNSIGLEKLSIKRSAKGYIEVDDMLRTSIKSIYAVGDINGLSQLAHAASDQGVSAVEHMFGGRAQVEKQIIPACIFAELEIASAGISEQEASAQGLPYKISKFPYSANGKALTMGAEEGFVKVIYDERWGEILGVHIIGEEASTLIGEAVMAMRLEATAKAAGETIHAHPTLSETLMEAFLGASKGAVHA